MTVGKKRFKQFVRRIVWLVLQQDKQLQTENLLARYRSGYFPMTGRLGIVKWEDPERRAIIPLDERFHVGKRLTRKLRSGCFEVTFDQAFRSVVDGCAELNPRRKYTWISPEIIEASNRLHRQGYAHSVEVWRDGQLVGGEYGFAIGGFFSGESMFTREDYASRVAMVYLVKKLRECGFSLLDTQVLSDVVCDFGAYEISRDEYKSLLANALSLDVKL